VIDCATFQSCEIDALYFEPGSRELDEEASAAMAEHAATCAACSARYARLRGTRRLVLSVAVEAVPNDFEARIMAAVDAGLAQRASMAGAAPRLAAVPAAAPSPGPPAGPHAEGGAKIFEFMSRPAFAVAAGFLLVLGAGTAIMLQSGRSSMAMARSDDESAAKVAAPPAAAAPGESPLAQAGVPMATVAPVAPTAVVAAASAPSDRGEPSTGAMAFAESKAAARPPPMAAKPSMARPSGPRPDDRAFAAAKSLYASGRYAEALPKFEALSASNPEAELYAARCIAKTKGCAAAEARFDSAAQSNAGTEAGSRAQIEGAKCYQQTGDLVAARKRYESAKDEGVLAAEATKALESLDGKSGAGTPGAGVHAAPKAAAPAAAPAPTTLR
jgi:hypothetical protein